MKLKLCALYLLTVLSGTSFATEVTQVSVINETKLSKISVISPAPDKITYEVYDATLLYWCLAAELSINTDQHQSALEYYMQATMHSEDPKIAARATSLAVKLNEFNAAITAGAIWAERAPKDVTAQQVMASLFFQTGYLKEAYPYLVTLAKMDKARPEIAIAQLSSQFKSKAMKQRYLNLLKFMASEHPDLPAAHLAIAHVAMQISHTPMAMHATQVAIEKFPELARAKFLRSEIIRQHHSHDAALLYLKNVSLKDPSNDVIRLGLVEQYIKADNYPEALSQLKLFKTDSDFQSESKVYAAQIYLNKGDAHKAYTLLKDIAFDSAHRDFARFLMGKTLEMKGEMGKAIYWYRHVFKGPYHVLSHARAAVLLNQQGKPHAALQLLSKVQMKTARDLKHVQLTKAEIRFKQDDHERALVHLNKAMEYLPRDASLRYARAHTYRALGQIDAARKEFKFVLSMQPHHVPALNSLGYLLLHEQKNVQRAAPFIKKAFALAPNDAHVLDSMGWLLYHQGRMAEAIILLEKAFSILPDADIQAHLQTVRQIRRPPVANMGVVAP